VRRLANPGSASVSGADTPKGAAPAPPPTPDRPARSDPAAPTPHTIWTTLRGDHVLRIAAVVVALLLVPYAVPLLPRERLGALSEDYFDIILIGLTLVALLYRLGQVAHTEERRFWRHLAVGLGFWLAVRVFYVALPDIRATMPAAIVADVLYLMFYVSVVLATETKPHLPSGWSSADPGFRLRSAGSVTLAAGLLVYFVLVPSNVNPEAYDSWLPSLYMYLALDAYLVNRFAFLALRADRGRWRVLYGVLGVTATLWGLTDLIECLSFADQLQIEPGTAIDLLWWLPFGSIMLAARLRDHPFSETAGGAAGAPPAQLRPVWSPLLLSAFGLPIMHLGCYAFGLLDEESRATREVVVVTSLIALGALAVVHQRLLERRTRTLESDLHAAHERLEQTQRLEALGRLAGGVAHDFNNLLTAIIGHSELLLDQLDGQPELRMEVEQVKQAGDRAAALTRQLLAFSRRQVLQPKTLDLNVTVADTDRMLRRLIREDIDLVLRQDPELGSVRADPGQIQQVLVNLAVNAGDAMPGGGRLTVTTANVDLADEGHPAGGEMAAGAYVTLTVSDTGHGMTPETQARIFEPFFTTKESGRGTGLGLSTVYGIIQQSGGDILVDSRAGGGTTFTVYLPRVDARPDRPEAAPAPVADTHGSETILLVEDEEVVRRLARHILEAQGYEVMEATEGVAAIGLSQRHTGPIHLLLTDVVMPGMNGRELARQVARLRPDMRILYMSGHVDNPIGDGYAPGTGTDFLQKPFSPASLVTKVRRTLDASN